MSRVQLCFFLDEDVQQFLAEALRTRGFDALHVYEVGRGGLPDEDQLAFSSEEGRCLVSYNKRDFAVLWAACAEAGREHSGIVVAKRHAPGVVLRALLKLAADEMKGRIAYI